mmetsp:Transcript_94969/g.188116  ORF Transcript_94969/g.188116 Transcript_94969/m.188116 type:complete len:431 (+) Transcript_94969:115-1407(+)
MGNSTTSSSGGWFFNEESTPVLLRLLDARSLEISPSEELIGIVGLGADLQSVATVKRGEPVTVSVGVGTTLSIDFEAQPLGRTSTGGNRYLGNVSLPLECVARRCGGSLYHMWFPLEKEPPAALTPQSGSGSVTPQSGSQLFEQFDRSLRSAARDPRLPVVCLSLCQASSPQAARDRYELHTDPPEKALRFDSLLQSHAQHSRLLQALYRQCRAVTRSQEGDGQSLSRTDLNDSWSWASLERSRRSRDMPVGSLSSDPGQPEEVSRLRRDIDTTTREANARINQASDAIRTLRERLSAKQAEHEQMRRETARQRQDAEALETQNEQFRLQLIRSAREGGGEDRAEELRRLRREAEVLKEQKDALVLILEDLYGAVGSNGGAEQEAPQNQEPPPVDDEATPNTVEPLSETWTNMLPRPSELFGPAVLEERK